MSTGFKLDANLGGFAATVQGMTITETRTVRFRNRSELLALPPTQLGFEPHESIVALRMSGKEVVFTARLDIAYVQASCIAAAQQISVMAASNPAPDSHWLLLCYTASPNSGASVTTRLAEELDAVSLMFLTDGASTWEVVDGIPIEEESVELSSELRRDLAELRSRAVEPSRQEAIACVYRWQPSKQRLAEARRRIRGLQDEGRLRQLRTLVDADSLTDTQAAELAVLLSYEEMFGEMVAQLSTETASKRRAALLAARVQAPARSLTNVLSLLALAYWLEGDGSLAADCLTQLGGSVRTHPLARTVAAMLQLGIPPSRWDEH